MFFLVCFYCVKVFTQEEGHCCPYNDGNEGESSSADVILSIRAEPADLRKDSKAYTKSINCVADSKNSRRSRTALKFSLVATGTGEKTTNTECRMTNNDVCDGNEATRNKNAGNLNSRAPDLRKALPSAFPDNVADYLSQSTRSESNRFASTTSKCIVKYPTESQQTSEFSRQTAWNDYNKYATTQDANIDLHAMYNYNCNNSEISRIENLEKFHRLERDSRNAIPQSGILQSFPEKMVQHSRQYAQPEMNKYEFRVNSHMPQPSAFFQQAAHSSRQFAWNEYYMYAPTQGTHTKELRTVPEMSDHSSRLQKEIIDFNNTTVQGTQAIQSWLHRKAGRVFTCEKCGKWFKTRERFDDHVQSDCDPNPYKCDESGLRFARKRLLMAHSLCHQDKFQMQYV